MGGIVSTIGSGNYPRLDLTNKKGDFMEVIIAIIIIIFIVYKLVKKKDINTHQNINSYAHSSNRNSHRCEHDWELYKTGSDQKRKCLKCDRREYQHKNSWYHHKN